MESTLLANGACEVRRRAARLECETGLNGFDLLLAGLVWGGLALGVRFALQADPRGVLLALGCALAAWAFRRRCAAVGRVVVDRVAGEIVQVRAGRERRWPFAAVARLEVREDGFDASRPDLYPWCPSWLEVGLRDGTVLRIAKGSACELRPVVQTLEAWEVGRVPE